MRFATLCSVLLLASTCWAQQGIVVDRDTDQQYGHNRTMSEKRIVRASELIGLNVQNNADETVGEINDIVIDTNEGRVRYVAVSVGGFLGMGDQLFAIPWSSFESRKDGDEHKVLLNVNKETLQKAKGFNEDNWPDMANEQWQLENDRAYLPRSSDRRVITPHVER